MGLISTLITEGVCVLYHDYRSGSFHDWSLNGNPGEPSGVIWGDDSLNYISSGDTVLVSDDTPLQLSEGCLVLLATYDISSSGERIISKRDGGGTNYDWFASGSSELSFYDGSSTRTRAVTLVGSEYNAINFADGETPEGFQDGTSIGNYSGTVAVSADDADLEIGNYSVAAAPLVSPDVKAALIFNRKLTDEEHRRLYDELDQYNWEQSVHTKVSTDLVAQIKPSDPSTRLGIDTTVQGGEVLDLSGMGNHGTVEGQTTKITQLGNSLVFSDDVTDKLSCGTDTSLNIVGSHTMSCWVKTQDISGADRELIEKDHYNIGISSSEEIVYVTRDAADTTWEEMTSLGSLIIGKWHHVAAIFDANSGTKSIYIDGIITGTATAKTDGGVPSSPSSICTIGDDAGFTLIAPQIFSEAKSATWVAAQFALGSPAMWHTDWAAQESTSNDTTSYLSNTPFVISTGTWIVSNEEIGGEICKVIKCVAAGIIYMPTVTLGQNSTGSAYGTWEWYQNKTDAGELSVAIISTDTSTSSNGYNVKSTTTEEVKLQESGVGDMVATAASYITADTWHNIKVTRKADDEFELFVDDVSIGTDTNSSIATSTYLVIEMDADDMIALADQDGGHSIVKRFTV